VIVAGDGNNYVDTGNANDEVVLGDGDNTVVTGNGTDSTTLGNGSNTFAGGTGNDVVHVGTGYNNRIDGGKGTNVCYLPQPLPYHGDEVTNCTVKLVGTG
jgi:Ca2+-binding RTX toxin-like protein